MISTNKKLYSNDELIEHLKSKKGICFEKISIDETKSLLKERNYYTKISSYRHNYEKYINKDHEKYNQYKDLDFAYLKDLSIIDMHLRNIFIKMILALEHSFRSEFLDIVSTIEGENGYLFSQNCFVENRNLANRIHRNLKSSYCSELIKKYDEEFHSKNTNDIKENYVPNIPIWVLCEVMSFGDFANIIQTFNKIHNESKNKKKYKIKFLKCIFKVKEFRNAIAHNNAIINNLKDNTFKPIQYTQSKIESFQREGLIFEKNLLKNKQLHNILTFIIAFYEFENSKQIKQNLFTELKELFDVRMVRNKAYYEHNQVLCDAYMNTRELLNFIMARLEKAQMK